MGHLRDVGGEQAPEKVVVALQPVCAEKRGTAVLRLAPLHAHRVSVGQRHQGYVGALPPEGQQLLHPRPLGHRFPRAGRRSRRFRRGNPRRGEAQLLDQLGKLQPQKQLVEGGGIYRDTLCVLRPEVQGRVAADGGQLIGHTGLLRSLGQPFPHRGLGLHLLQVRVDGLHAAVALDQVHGGLLPDAFDAGDVVAGIPHQGLQVDHVDGRKAVGRTKGFGRHLLRGGLPHTGGHQLDPGMLIHQLQGVLVSGHHHRIPARRGVPGGNGADKVVGLPALQLVAGDVHRLQHVLQKGHLAGKLVGHPLALGLVSLVGQMPEGRRGQVEGDAQGVRLLLVRQLLKDVQKSVDGVGGLAVPGGEHPHAVKSPVDDGIAVDDHELHGEPPASG